MMPGECVVSGGGSFPKGWGVFQNQTTCVHVYIYACSVCMCAISVLYVPISVLYVSISVLYVCRMCYVVLRGVGKDMSFSFTVLCAA